MQCYNNWSKYECLNRDCGWFVNEVMKVTGEELQQISIPSEYGVVSR